MGCSPPASSVHGIFPARGVSLSTPLKYDPVTQSRALLKKLWVTQRSVAVSLLGLCALFSRESRPKMSFGTRNALCRQTVVDKALEDVMSAS